MKPCLINELPPLAALPKFEKFSKICGTSLGAAATAVESQPQPLVEYPIEIELGREHQYHSIFVCPISREIVHPNNPPIMLPCGHVISESITPTPPPPPSQLSY